MLKEILNTILLWGATIFTFLGLTYLVFNREVPINNKPSVTIESEYEKAALAAQKISTYPVIAENITNGNCSDVLRVGPEGSFVNTALFQDIKADLGVIIYYNFCLYNLSDKKPYKYIVTTETLLQNMSEKDDKKYFIGHMIENGEQQKAYFPHEVILK